MTDHANGEDDNWVSKADAAAMLHASRWGVSWLLFSEDLEDGYSNNLGLGVTRDSLNLYRHWLASSTRYERGVHRSLNVVFAPIKVFLKLVGGADVPSPL